MENVEYFLPSEIDRFVYGFLKFSKCDSVAEKFLVSSKHLGECLVFARNNKLFQANVNGLSLIDVLNQFVTMSDMIFDIANKLINNDDEQFYDVLKALLFVLDSKNCNFKFINHEKQSSVKVTNSLEKNNKNCDNKYNLDTLYNKNNSNTPLGTAITKDINGDFCDDDQTIGDLPATQVSFQLIYQKIMEHPKLHERLAENINKIINESKPTKSSISCSEDLEKAIQKVILETETDHSFDELLKDIIGIPCNEIYENEEEKESDCNFSLELDNDKNVNLTLEQSLTENILISTSPLDLDDNNKNMNLKSKHFKQTESENFIPITSPVLSSQYQKYEINSHKSFNNEAKNLDIESNASTTNAIIIRVPPDKTNDAKINCTESVPYCNSQSIVIPTTMIATIEAISENPRKNRFVPIAPKPKQCVAENQEFAVDSNSVAKKRRTKGPSKL